MSSIEDENSFTDEAFQSFFPVTKEQFQELFRACDDSPVECPGGFRYVGRKDLLLFLCKLRHGLSDEFLCHMFKYSSRQAVSMAIGTVRQSLMQTFVPRNIGFNSITRKEYINNHVTPFANELYNPQPEIPRVIAIIDGTYTFIHKSSNYRALRQSFCVHKGQHLVKPHMIVAPDGRILPIQGPYFSDSRNNDASILRNEFERDAERMRQWFREDDIVIVDRGYRDATDLLARLGITCHMTAYLERGQHQLTTAQANASRIITKNRWIVEARNGHIKSIFKFFANDVQIQHVPHIGEFYQIAGAIINRFRPSLLMRNVNVGLAREMRARVNDVNVLQVLVEAENLHTRNAQRWVRLDAAQLDDFPRLTLDYLRDLTIGTYQIKLSPSYIQDTLSRNNEEELEVEMLRNEQRIPTPGLIRVRVYSRFRNRTRYQLWVRYRPIVERDEEMETEEESEPEVEAAAAVDDAAEAEADVGAAAEVGAEVVRDNADNDDDNENDDYNPIEAYYCTCRSGARTIGTCAHIASVLWYLGHARHFDNVRYPSLRLLETVNDAHNRPV